MADDAAQGGEGRSPDSVPIVVAVVDAYLTSGYDVGEIREWINEDGEVMVSVELLPPPGLKSIEHAD